MTARRPRVGPVLAAFAALWLAAPAARAGEPACDPSAGQRVEKVIAASAAARRLERALEASGAEIAIVARVGSDLRRHGIVWTHAGIAWRDDPAARWQVTHLLNDCAGRYSRLYRQGLVNFFLDDPLVYDALILVPGPATRAALVARLRSGAALSLHQPLYSAMSYPFATTYQNSNQFVLENLALAQLGATTGGREAAIARLRGTGYAPHVVRLTGFERIGAGMKANVRFDDHPREADQANRYAVVTVASLEAWLAATGDLARRAEVR